MKKATVYLSLIGSLVLMLQCKNEPAPTSDASAPAKPIKLSSGNMHRVNLTEAKNAISAYYTMYDTKLKEILRVDPNANIGNINDAVRGFKIGWQDLVYVLDPSSIDTNAFQFKSARAYLGMVGDKMHMYFTPIQANGRDTILSDSTGTAFLYDLTAPCPNTCDTSSVLYKAFSAQ